MHSAVPAVILAAIVVGYLVIAVQFYLASRGEEDNAGRRALWLLLGIFILCSLAGYMPRLIGLPFAAEVAIHLALVLVTWWFIFTNQAALIMKALR